MVGSTIASIEDRYGRVGGSPVGFALSFVPWLLISYLILSLLVARHALGLRPESIDVRWLLLTGRPVHSAVALANPGGKVYCPDGTYLVDQITTNKTILLEGAGWSTVFKAKNSSSTPANSGLMRFGELTNVASKVILKNFALDGNRANQTTNFRGILLHVTDGLVEGVRVTSTKQGGIFIGGKSKRVQVLGCQAEDCIEGGIVSDSLMASGSTGDEPTDLVVSACMIVLTNERGIVISRSKNVVVSGNRCNGSVTGTGEDAITVTTLSNTGSFCDNVAVVCNVIQNAKTGIVVDTGPARDLLIADNVIVDTTITSTNNYPINIADSQGHARINIADNVIRNSNATVGIRCGADVAQVKIDGNMVSLVKGTGIVCSGFGGASIRTRAVISDNIVFQNDSSGIRVDRGTYIIRGNQVYNNNQVNQASGDAGHGIIIADETPANKEMVVLCQGNQCFDDQGTKTQKYGLYLNVSHASSRGLIDHNDFTGNNLGSINVVNATGLQIDRNLGFKTESRGTATILSGTTSIVVTHGLGYTPDGGDIVLIPTMNPTNDPGIFWPTAATSTQFTINCRNDPGAGGVTVSWQVRRLYV